MNKVKAAAGILTIFIVTPIWYYLFYQILKSVEASELMWFLFWVYMPIGILSAIIVKVAEATD